MESFKHTSNDVGDQGTARWRQYRAGYVTGSGFSEVLAKGKAGKESKARQTYRMSLVTERITGLPSPEIYAAALSWGKENEGPAKVAYELYMAEQGQSVFIEPAEFVQHPTIDWVGTSPDGLVGERGMVEVKCPWNTANHLMTIIRASAVLANALMVANDEPIVAVPEEHIPQIQGNLWVLDRDWCDFISYDPRVPKHLQLYVARVYRDEAYIKNLEAEALKFLDEIEGNISVLILPEDNFPEAKEQEK